MTLLPANKASVVLGSQWGDEGKGKLVDILTGSTDVCARCAGGNNAGHTIVADIPGKGKTKFDFHLLPSGLVNPKCLAFIGTGVVLNVPALFDEVDTNEAKGLSCSPRIFVSDRAQLVFECHLESDGVSETKLGSKSIGTTRKGIGPTYTTKAARTGLRVYDLFQPTFPEKLRSLYKQMSHAYGFEYDVEAEIEKYVKVLAPRLKPMVVDGTVFLQKAFADNKRILVEGANALMLDIDAGTYPYVTSSNTGIGGVITGLGIPPQKIGDVYGVVKAYTTRVGGGPFPTEQLNADGEKLQNVGFEVGVTTGRARRCGWLDLVLLKYSTFINGYTALNLTKLDVLDSFPTIKVAVGYKDKTTHKPLDVLFPADLTVLENIEIEYKEFAGWNTSIESVRTYDDLPENCKNYVQFIEDFLEVPIKWIGTGPHRESMILKA